jgi:hypothetical protein
MATRGTIALELENGEIVARYSHYDNDTNGEILKEFYSDPEKLKELLSIGSIVSLDCVVKETEFYSDRYVPEPPWHFANWNEYVARLPREEYNYCLKSDGCWMLAKAEESYYLL